jgi:Zn-dependent peptidase ImmA (M78 family)
MIVRTYPINENEQAIIAFHQERAPVDIAGMAFSLGINVWEDQLDDQVSGKLFKDQHGNGGSSGYSIVVNGSEPLVRKRFTIAHDIAHFLLHRNQIGSSGVQDDVYYRSGLTNTQETEANGLAADLLMPNALVEQLVASGYKTVEKLADALKVSVPAMKIRLGIPVA